MVYGYGYRYWEQERGMRHLLYPALLAAPLAALDAVGIRDPMLQGSLLRLMVSLIALAASALFAWQFHRRGDSVAALGVDVHFRANAGPGPLAYPSD